MTLRPGVISSVLLSATMVSLEIAQAQANNRDVVGLRHRVDRLEAQLAQLQEAVSQLEDPLKPVYVAVNCGAGQTVGDALAQAKGKSGPLYVSITGMCVEEVTIARDNVTLMGAASGAGIRGPGSGAVLSLVNNVRKVSLNQLVIDADNAWAGIVAGQGSSFVAMGVTVEGGPGAFGIDIRHGSSGYLYGCVIEDGSMGISVSGAAELQDCSVRGHWIGVFAADGGTVNVSSSTIEDNDMGIAAFAHGSVRVAGSVIERNRNGVDALQNSTIHVRDESRIADNREAGAHIGAGSLLTIERTTIEGNHGQGILVEQGSTLSVFGVTITRSGGDGITLRDMSNGLGGWQDPGVGLFEITNNGGWGINCSGPPAVAPVQNGFALDRIQFSGNRLGPTNCPAN